MAKVLTEDEAARYIQGLFRTRKARANLARIIGTIYEAVWDEDQQAYYYYNVRTGASAWTKPAFAREEDIFTPRARAAAEAKEQKRADKEKQD